MAAAVAWLLIAASTVLGAVALYPTAGMKTTMGPVLLWAVAGLYVFTGLACLVAPNAVRTVARSLLTRNAARMAGIAYIIVGAALFRVATATHVPLLAQVFGVIAFMEGGVQVLRPEVCIIITEWWIDQGNAWYRGAGLVCLALGALFAWAAGPTKPSEPTPARIEAPAAPAPAEVANPAQPSPTPSGLPPVLPPPPLETAPTVPDINPAR